MEALGFIFGEINLFLIIGLIAVIIIHYVMLAKVLNNYVKERELDNIFGVFAWIPGLQIVTLGYLMTLALADKHDMEMTKAGIIVGVALAVSIGLIYVPFVGIASIAINVYLMYVTFCYILPSNNKTVLYTVLSSIIYLIALPICLNKALKLSQE